MTAARAAVIREAHGGTRRRCDPPARGTAFDNILGVMTGDDVSLYRPPDWVQVEVRGQIIDQWQYPMENPAYHPPTMDVQ